jgi:hypothetical protein
VLNIISFKRKLFKTESFLYNSDDSAVHFDLGKCGKNETSIPASHNAIATDFILSKFKDFVLYKMTNHVVSHSNMISTERILSSSRNLSSPLAELSDRNAVADLDEEQREQTDIDQIKFEKLKSLYKNNLEYFGSVCTQQERETHAVLIEFLNMLNNWKLRNFDATISTKLISGAQHKSLFIQSIRNVLNAYQHVRGEPEKALLLCKMAVENLRQFNSSVNIYSSNYYLIEVNI